MKVYDWNKEKNRWLIENRGIGFEEIVDIIHGGKDVLAMIESRNKKKYANQRVFIVRIGDYAYEVPFVEDEEKVFFKTIIPSRRSTKKYMSKE